MSDNIPFEIQTEIMKMLPVKSLLRFRSVSKTWKSLIDSSDFIAQYSNLQTKPHHLLVSYTRTIDDHAWKYVSIVDDDDDTFPQQQVSIPLDTYHDLMSSSNGLMCLYRVYYDGLKEMLPNIILWNFSIRKGVNFVVPNVGNGIYAIALGFGVCRVNRDLKIVKIRYILRREDLVGISCIPWQVEVFTLSTRVWRNPYSNYPRKSIKFDSLCVDVDGCVYWIAIDRIAKDDGFRSCNLIISFDMTTEVFKEVSLPNNLVHHGRYKFSMSKLKESLVILELGFQGNISVFSVWMMEDGVSNSFRLLYNFNVNVNFETSYAFIRGFRKSGEPIVEIFEYEHDGREYKHKRARLVVYEPYSKRMNNLGVDEKGTKFSVYPYAETLALLDQPDLTDKV